MWNAFSKEGLWA
jgi:hypothetical protein